jgi:hypothetical protein
LIKNSDKFSGRLTAWVNQVEATSTKKFRRQALSLFKFLLETTPQASGRAVANWKVGINRPNNDWNPNLGEQDELVERKDGTGAYKRWVTFHQKGDRKWIDHALRFQQYKFEGAPRGASARQRIQLGDVVYFTNNVQGDDDELGPAGQRDKHYLKALQDPGYWAAKLREVNQPYITVAEAMLIHSWESFADAGSDFLEDYV